MTVPRVATCQFEPTVGRPDTNIEAIEELARKLPESVEFAVFPELCVVGYDLTAVPTHRTSVPGPITDRLTDVVRDVGVDLVVGIPEVDTGTVYNSLVYVGEDGVLATYRKRRLWGDEANCFDAGTEPVTVDTPAGTVGLLLCYDLNFPELSLTYARDHCDVLAVSAAWRQSFERDWRLLCRARALDGTCYVVGSNHVGTQAGRKHAGESCIVGPRGDIVSKTTDGSAVVSAPVTPESLTLAREKNPVWNSRQC
ncbi:carbon-nitrogen hydrolase family protein [Haladaptatus sp. AB643]|uniref:carbon-nitrogen hydrolase family protein n=1 Tax=Haladaptatus sp. AB643 TaxID=2934174 RepID=UPI00209BF006|nr:carbon-nitrogen hydrolase family protein [Haladaptatus sp. AB643]MCO8243424.1 carbon-nitrogen hydrolase family protein [Haladaptatus sp. AB643]